MREKVGNRLFQSFVSQEQQNQPAAAGDSAA
jgi:hypothetical protein